MKNNRASIFLPYDALTGFRKMISNVTKVKMEKIELEEDKIKENEYYLNNITKGMMVSIIYFDDGEYFKIQGLVSKLDYYNKTITIVKTKLNIKNIYSIYCEEIPDYNPFGI